MRKGPPSMVSVLPSESVQVDGPGPPRVGTAAMRWADLTS